jgi:hypothetical protein
LDASVILMNDERIELKLQWLKLRG